MPIVGSAPLPEVLKDAGDREKVLRLLIDGRRTGTTSVEVEIGGKRVRVSSDPPARQEGSEKK